MSLEAIKREFFCKRAFHIFNDEYTVFCISKIGNIVAVSFFFSVMSEALTD